MTMVQPAGGGIPIRIDSLQTLENFLNMYDLPALALFREALDNALDENATTIKINYGKTGNDKWISFEDNANGMSKNVFKIYLSISRSTKQQTGQTVGFAGIGVALLGRNHPIGMALGAILISFLERSSQILDLKDVPKEIERIMQGIIILTVVVGYEIVRRFVLTQQIKEASKEVLDE